MAEPATYTPEQVAWHQEQATAQGVTLDQWYTDRATEDAQDEREQAECEANFPAMMAEAEWADQIEADQEQAAIELQEDIDQWEADHYGQDEAGL